MPATTPRCSAKRCIARCRAGLGPSPGLRRTERNTHPQGATPRPRLHGSGRQPRRAKARPTKPLLRIGGQPQACEPRPPPGSPCAQADILRTRRDFPCAQGGGASRASRTSLRATRTTLPARRMSLRPGRFGWRARLPAARARKKPPAVAAFRLARKAKFLAAGARNLARQADCLAPKARRLARKAKRLAIRMARLASHGNRRGGRQGRPRRRLPLAGESAGGNPSRRSRPWTMRTGRRAGKSCAR
jgi:hypothetical protein